MRAYDNGSFYSVAISSVDVAEFMRSWPCSGLTGHGIWAQFDKRNGDLVNLRHSPRDQDGAALLAIIHDGQEYAKRKLGITP